MPHAALTGHLEEQPALDVYPFGVPGDDMKDEDNQPLEGQLAFALEMLWILLEIRADAAGEESENILNKSAGLARKFHARRVPLLSPFVKFFALFSSSSNMPQSTFHG